MTSLNANNLKVHDECEDTSKVVKNAVRCSICFANADLKGNMYFCQDNPRHIALATDGLFEEWPHRAKSHD